MCGICGQFKYNSDLPVDERVIRRMTRTMVHRGPDDEGYYVSGSLGFGFRRLSIIDLEHDHQPMSDRDGNIWVLLNGEIYNFPELRAELEKWGHAFRTKSDTEVIVHGYKEWGVDVLSHLNGMFGLAIWDEKCRRLMIARDRAGIKMLYYRIDSGSLSFGSEIRALLSADGTRPDIDLVALNLFLRYRYTPSPLTLFKRIRKLAAGTRLIIENGSPRLERWWNFSPMPLCPGPDLREIKEKLLELYKQSVKRHLISDVPLGLLLSGGVDSGLLLSLMNLYGDSWKTFTVGYGEGFADDELRDAASTARYLRAVNVPVRITKKVFERSLPEIISHLEEPVATSSIVPMYHVCQRASQYVKTAFVGQGPDELFGGYKRHIGVRYSPIWRALPKAMRVPLKGLLSVLPRNETIKRGLYSLDLAHRMKRYQQVFSIVPPHVVDGLFRGGTIPKNAGDEILACWNGLEPLMENVDELGGLQFIEIRSSLPDELLMYADKLSMAHSLELRVPYLDYEIVEYVETLPAFMKVRNGSGKWLHKQICKSFLPREVVGRKKRGFAANVVDAWFRDSLRGGIANMLLDGQSLLYGHLRYEAVLGVLRDHQAGRHDYHKLLFSLVVLEQWLRAAFS